MKVAAASAKYLSRKQRIVPIPILIGFVLSVLGNTSRRKSEICGNIAVQGSSECRTALACLDGSGCSAPFSKDELEKVLDVRTLKALDNLVTDQELRQVRSKSLFIGNINRQIYKDLCIVHSAHLEQ